MDINKLNDAKMQKLSCLFCIFHVQVYSFTKKDGLERTIITVFQFIPHLL